MIISVLPIAVIIRIAKAEEYIAELTKEADKLATHAGRKTLKAEDIEMAAKN